MANKFSLPKSGLASVTAATAVVLLAAVGSFAAAGNLSVPADSLEGGQSVVDSSALTTPADPAPAVSDQPLPADQPSTDSSALPLPPAPAPGAGYGDDDEYEDDDSDDDSDDEDDDSDDEDDDSDDEDDEYEGDDD